MKTFTFIFAILFLLLFSSFALCEVITQPLIEKMKETEEDEHISVNVIMIDQPDYSYLNNLVSGKEISERRTLVIDYLKKIRDRSQRRILSYLQVMEKEGKVKSVRSLWLGNSVCFKATKYVIEEVAKIPHIKYIDYDEVRKILPNPKKQGPSLPSGREIVWNVSKVRAPEVWSLGYTGENIIVSIMDSGVRYTHLDLADHIWTNSGEIPNNSIDDDGNGYVDDYYGYDFCNSDGDPIDDNGHGTRCAGIIAGDGTAGSQTGVAPDARIMSLKVTDWEGYAEPSDVWEAMQYSLNMGAHIISFSGGYYHHQNPDRQQWRNNCNSLLAGGLIMSVAAGNMGDSLENYPAPDNVATPADVPPPWLHPDQSLIGGQSAVITVGSTDMNDIIASFSSKGPVTWEDIAPWYDYPYGPEMGLIDPDISAPGVQIKSLAWMTNDDYEWPFKGTSYAAPHVTGTIALMLSKNSSIEPAIIDSVLETTALDLGSAGKDNEYGAGRLDCYEALSVIQEFGPHIVTTSYEPSINPGEWANIYVKVKNYGTLATDGGPTISFPSLNNVGDEQFAELVDCSPAYYGYQEYPKSSWIYDRDGNLMQANYLMVELADNHIQYGETMFLEIKVQPQEEGNFYFYVRCAMGYDGTYYNDPPDGQGDAIDQQGWWVYKHTIIVAPYYDAVNVDHTLIEDWGGDGDGIPESGEDLTLKVYLKNKDSQTITNVVGNLSSSIPEVTIDDDRVVYSSLDPGEVSWGGDAFNFHTSPSYSGVIDFDLNVSFKRLSQPYYDSEVIPITVYPQGSVPYFVDTSIVFYDTSSVPGHNNNNNGILESGERAVPFDVELFNAGNAIGIDLEGEIEQKLLNGVPVINDGCEYYPDIPPEQSAFPQTTFRTDLVSYGFAGQCTLYMWVQYGEEEDSQLVKLHWDIGTAPYVWITPMSWNFGTVSPGDTVRKDFNARNPGTENLIIDSIVTDNVDTWIEGVSFPWIIPPQINGTFTILIDTEGLNAYITRNITVFSNDQGSNTKSVVITGTVVDPPTAEYVLLGSTPSYEIPRACCIKDGDTDGDGKHELIVGTGAGAGNYSRIYIYERVSDNDYQNVWISTDVLDGGMYSRNGGMDVGDIDSDGNIEIMLGTGAWATNPKVYIYKNNGNDSWYLWYQGLGCNEKITCLTFADADGDGKNEIIYGSGPNSGSDGRVRIYENNGGNSFTNTWTSPLLADFGRIGSIKVADVDKDGKNEIVITANDDDVVNGAVLYIYETNGDNSFFRTFIDTLDNGDDLGTYNIAIYDLDNDGKNEIAIGCTSAREVWIFEVVEDDSFELNWPSPAFGRDLLCINAGDTDLDGMGEVIGGCDDWGKPLTIFEAFADNSYIEVWGDTNHITENPYDICICNTNSTPEDEFAVVDIIDRILIFGIEKKPNLTVSSSNIHFSDLVPEEGTVDTVSALVRNEGTAMVTQTFARFFDGDPESGGIQIGSDIQIDSLDVNESSQIEIEWIPTLSDTHYIYVVVDPDSLIEELNEDDNIAFKPIYVYDDDTEPPVIDNVNVSENPGDGDGWLEDNEVLKISWELQDSSGIDTTYCLVDTSYIPLAGDYFVIDGPFAYGEHRVIITATDADNTPETSVDTSYFFVYYHAPSVTSTNPQDGDSLVSIFAQVSATFNEDMDSSSINDSSFIIRDSTGSVMLGSVYYIPSSNSAIYVPSSYLMIGMKYTATLVGDSSKNVEIDGEGIFQKNPFNSSILFKQKERFPLASRGGIQDIHGNYLESDYIWSFKTMFDSTPPSIVTLISPIDGANLDNSVITFNWYNSSDSLSGVRNYLLQYALNNSFSQGLVETTLVDTTFTVSLVDTTYYWRVKSFDYANNSSEWSTVWNFTVDTKIPSAPSLLSPINGIYLGDSLVTFEWTEVTMVLSDSRTGYSEHISAGKKNSQILSSPIRYVVQIDTVKDFTPPVVEDTAITTTHIISLYERDRFFWRVRAFDLAGNQGEFTESDSFGVDISAPVIESTTVWNDTIYQGPFEIRTKVTDNITGLDSVLLYYWRVEEDPDWVMKMMHASGDWFTDTIPAVTSPDDTVKYYVMAVDKAEPGNVSTDPAEAPSNFYSFIANNVGVEEMSEKQITFSFKVNPFVRNSTIFRFSLPNKSEIMLNIYNITGRKVSALISGVCSTGNHSVSFKPASSGIYFYRFESSCEKKFGKIIIF